MNSVRAPAVSGTFYPSNRTVLRQTVNKYLETAVSPSLSQKQSSKIPKAIIAPHAGYIYSGAIAGVAYQRLQGRSEHIKRVVLIGPAHTMRIRGLATVSVDALVTPLGEVEVDKEVLEQIRPFPQLQTNDAVHAQEHGLEVHLPFLQMILQEFKVVPLVVGESSGAEVAEVLNALWGAKETLIIVSSDLSHFYDYKTAVKRDTQTAASILNLEPEKLKQESACGRLPIQGLLIQAKQKGLSVHLLDLKNSGDTAGNKDRVVGYGAFVFTS